MTTIEISAYDAMLKKIADDIIKENCDKPTEIVTAMIARRMDVLSEAAVQAFDKVMSEIDSVGVREFARLTEDEAQAWKLVVAKYKGELERSREEEA